MSLKKFFRGVLILLSFGMSFGKHSFLHLFHLEDFSSFLFSTPFYASNIVLSKIESEKKFEMRLLWIRNL